MDADLVLRFLYVSCEAGGWLGLEAQPKLFKSGVLALAVCGVDASNRCDFDLHWGFVSRKVHFLGRCHGILSAACVFAPDSILCSLTLAK